MGLMVCRETDRILFRYTELRLPEFPYSFVTVSSSRSILKHNVQSKMYPELTFVLPVSRSHAPTAVPSRLHGCRSESWQLLPLNLAIGDGNAHLINIVLDSGADVNAQQKSQGRQNYGTPLEYRIRCIVEF